MDKCKKCYRYDPTGQTDCAVCDFKETYIERSKIDKAIEEIKQDMIAHSGTGEEVIQAYCDGLKKALEYLGNIGE